MPKINKDTLVFIPSEKIKVYKHINGTNYYCSFYCGKAHTSSGIKEICLKETNILKAKVLALKYKKDFLLKNPNTTLSNEPNFDKDIAQPFLRFRYRKYNIAKLNQRYKSDDLQSDRDKSKYDKIKHFFENINYNNTEELEDKISNDVLYYLKDNLNVEYSTINKYFSIIRQMCQRAKDRNVLNVVPEIPTLAVITKDRHGYLPLEQNLINKELTQQSMLKEDKFLLEVKDYLNLCRCAGFRPGLEVLNIRNKHITEIADIKNPKIRTLRFDVYFTKTKPKYSYTANFNFYDQLWPEIKSRHSNRSPDDYLLFPKVQNRNALVARIHKIFTRITMSLKLFYHPKDNTSRPVYSYRHTYATELYKQGYSISEIASSMNTSERMIRETYLDNTDAVLIERAKLLNKSYIKNKFKLIK